MKTNYSLLESDINYKFRDSNLLKLALTHKSFDNSRNNEKLEFLGDRVIGLILSKELFKLYPDEDVGTLDKKFAKLVNRDSCFIVSKKINLLRYIRIGKSLKRASHKNKKILSDSCESLIGAIYMDSGLSACENVVNRLWSKKILQSKNVEIDPKTKLQEYSLKIYKKLPRYTVEKIEGPSHKPQFRISVSLINSKKFYGVGNSKKEAQQVAAKKLIIKQKII